MLPRTKGFKCLLCKKDENFITMVKNVLLFVNQKVFFIEIQCHPQEVMSLEPEVYFHKHSGCQVTNLNRRGTNARVFAFCVAKLFSLNIILNFRI